MRYQLLILIFLYALVTKCKKENNKNNIDYPGNSILIIDGLNGVNYSEKEINDKISKDAGYNTRVVKILNLPNIQTIDLSPIVNLNELIISNNSGLNSVLLHNLKEVSNEISIKNNSNLSNISIPVLEKAGRIEISENEQLRKLEFKNLTSANKVILLSSTAFYEVNFPKLSSLNDSLYLQGIYSGINFPLLTNSKDLILYKCCDPQKPSSFSFPSLEKCGTLLLSTNYFNEYVLPKLNIAEKIILNNPLADIQNFSLTVLSKVKEVNISSNYGIKINNISLPKVDTLTTGLGISNLPNDCIINIPNLKYTGEQISFFNNTALTKIELPLLKSVGSFYVGKENTQLTNIHTPLLETVEGNIEFNLLKNTASNINLNLKELKDVLGDLKLYTKSDINLPRLRNVRGSLELLNSTKIDIPELENVGLSLYISGYQSITPLIFNKLVNVGYDIRIISNSITNLVFPTLKTL
ncbi:MAG: hypothetical protein ACOVQE_08080, partial [Chitinophagaceae bacterium]